jgi:hypothetical protein
MSNNDTTSNTAKPEDKPSTWSKVKKAATPSEGTKIWFMGTAAAMVTLFGIGYASTAGARLAERTISNQPKA